MKAIEGDETTLRLQPILAEMRLIDPSRSFRSIVVGSLSFASWFGLAFVAAMLTHAFQANRLYGVEPFVQDKPYRIVLFTPRIPNDHFWGPFAEFMDEAATDLGMELEVQYAASSRNLMQAQILDVCAAQDKPDAIVFQSFKRGGVKFLKIANRHEVTALLVNAGLKKQLAEVIGEPRTSLPYWLGEVLPDDFEAGFHLANALIDEARRVPQRIGEDGKVHIIGLIGVISDGASTQRLAGLQDAIAKRSDEAVLDQVVAADWNEELARRRCRVLHRRYPDASVVWSASDPMAIGAVNAISDRKLVPGKDVIIGGVDATPEAMELIEQGKMFASVGGHVLDGGWAAVLLHDFFHGIDLDRIPKRSSLAMRLVTRENLGTYRAIFDRSTWKDIDFRKFSLVHQPDQKGYQFDIRELVTKQHQDQSQSAKLQE
ncbi:ABC transporter substrate-binding protein [Rubripirellula obstinata]|nr:ABC transporter substrate-binding protein [Rubripirellula obstinata]